MTSPAGWCLERCAIELLERGWITDGNIEKFDEVAEVLRRLSRRAYAHQERCLVLPPSAVITKRSRCRGMTEQELSVEWKPINTSIFAG